MSTVINTMLSTYLGFCEYILALERFLMASLTKVNSVVESSIVFLLWAQCIFKKQIYHSDSQLCNLCTYF